MNYHDKQIVSRQWIGKLLNPDLKSATHWGLRKSKHGYCWYHASFEGKNLHYAMGYGGQFIILIPDDELVVVSAFNHDTPKGIDQEARFLKKNFPEIYRRVQEES